MSYKPLTPKQNQALMLLLAGSSQREVAVCLGVTEQTISRWRHKIPFFRHHFERSISAVREAAIVELQSGSRESIQFLRSLVANSEKTLSQRVAAAKILIAVAIKAPLPSTPPTKLKTREGKTIIRNLIAAAGIAGSTGQDPLQPGVIHNILATYQVSSLKDPNAFPGHALPSVIEAEFKHIGTADSDPEYDPESEFDTDDSPLSDLESAGPFPPETDEGPIRFIDPDLDASLRDRLNPKK